MKKILLFLMLPLVLSCEIQYDGETKLVVKGKVLDENNQPIANQNIKLMVTNSYMENFIYSNPSEVNFIGKTETKADGSYVMVIPEPQNFSEIMVETNPNDNLLNKKQFRNIQLTNFNNYELVLPDTKLYRKSDLCLLTVIPSNVNLTYALKDIKYIGAVANEFELMSPLDNSWSYNTTELVKKNQILIIRYTVKNYTNNQLLEFEQNVTITDTDQMEYVLNY